MIGVYFLLNRSKVVYVGQSKSVEKRIADHKRNKKFSFDSFRVIGCNVDRLLDYERRLIRLFNPRLNIGAGGKRNGAGRPKKEKTKVMRIPISKVSQVEAIIKER